MFPDFIDLIEILNKHKVRYLIVGGYAVARYAQPRYTQDLDILIHAEPRNAALVLNALREFGAPLRTRAALSDISAPAPRRLDARDFQDTGAWYTMGVAPIAIDVLTKIPGVVFSAAWKSRQVFSVDEHGRINANFISHDDLISAKLASSRLQDLADVEAIRHRDRAAASKRRAAAKKKSAKPR